MEGYAFLGGAFDPIHIGHLRGLVSISEVFNYRKLFILPYGISPTIKKTIVNPYTRRDMVSLAIEDNPKLGLEDIEIIDKKPAYTVNTLKKLRQNYGSDCHFSFIMGDDVYALLYKWYQWKSLFGLTNILVINRIGTKLNDEILQNEKGKLLGTEFLLNASVSETKNNNTDICKEFISYTHGKIIKLAMPLLDISSSSIRFQLANNKDVSFLLPAKVLQFIKAGKLYTNDR